MTFARSGALAALRALVVALLLAPGPAFALTDADGAEIAKAESYLNQVTTLKARFIQVSPAGGSVEGTLYLSRPGKMRLEYDPPSPILVVADGHFLIYYDKQLKQTSYLGLTSTPAGILVKPSVKLNGDGLKVVRVAHKPGLLDITVVSPENPDQGRITLIFNESPFALKQWQVVDPQGQVTMVSLYDARTGIPLDHDLFQFTDPSFLRSPVDNPNPAN